MDQDQSAEFMRDRKEAIEAGVGKFGIPDPRPDLDTEKPWVAHASAHFVDSAVGDLQGNSA
jgi:hypothetical protein